MTAWRGATARLLAALVAVALPLAVVSVWSSAVLIDTDRYVRTVGPLADEPAVRDAVGRRLETLVMDRLDARIDRLTERVRDGRLNGWLRQRVAQLGSGVEAAVRDAVRRAIDGVLASDSFRPAWEAANESAHSQLVAALEGDDARTDAQGRLTIDLGALVAAVLDVLADQGLPVAGRVPDLDATLPVLDAARLDEAQRGYRLLGRAGVGLPIGGAALGLVVLLLAPDRRRAAGWLGLGAVVAGGLVVLGVLLARAVALARLGGADGEVVGAVYDALTRSLVAAALVMGLVGATVVAGAWLAGRRVTARAAGTDRRPTPEQHS